MREGAIMTKTTGELRFLVNDLWRVRSRLHMRKRELRLSSSSLIYYAEAVGKIKEAIDLLDRLIITNEGKQNGE